MHLREPTSSRTAVYASSFFSGSKQVYKDQLRVVGEHDPVKSTAKIGTSNINYSWLRGAAETYQISPDIKDYVITEVPALTVDIPNRNLHAFPYNELTYFEPEMGNFVYKSFIGKCAFADHDNKDFTQAKGTIFDASLRKVPGWNIWKVYCLVGYDRTKDAALARAIEKGERRSYSMGAWCKYFISSLTGQLENGEQALKYPKGSVINGRLSYSLLSGVNFFELSSVNGPADVTAESHQLWYF